MSIFVLHYCLIFFRSVKQQPKTETKPPAQPSHQSHIPIATKRPPTSQQPKVKEDQKKIPASATPTVSKPLPSVKSTTAKASKGKLQSNRLRVSGTSSSIQSSRSTSPAPSVRRSRSKSTSYKKSRPGRLGMADENEQVVHRSRVGSRFSSPVKVEDLAYRPCISPVPMLLQNIDPPKRKPLAETKKSQLDNRAFVILDREVNNNSYDRANNLYKEQRWMSSWYSPPL